ncbi:MAG: nucleotide exchange factor GrpE [Anaerolineae bacterium]
MKQPIPEFVLVEEPAPVRQSASVDQLRTELRELIIRRERTERDHKRTERDAERGKRAFLLNLLRVADAFDRIFRDLDVSHMNGSTRSLMRSFELTQTLLEDALDREDTVAIENIEGRVLDLSTQEVIGVEETVDGREGIILEVRERGYLWRGRLLRPAKVIVSGKMAKETNHG